MGWVVERIAKAIERVGDGRGRDLALLMTALLAAGCGTVVNGTTQRVAISSLPFGASVTIDNVGYGRTPLVAKLKRKQYHFVRIHTPGYLPYDVALMREVSNWVWGNLLTGGFIGIGIDALSGGMHKLTPKQIEAELKPDGTSGKVLGTEGQAP